MVQNNNENKYFAISLSQFGQPASLHELHLPSGRLLHRRWPIVLAPRAVRTDRSAGATVYGSTRVHPIRWATYGPISAQLCQAIFLIIIRKYFSESGKFSLGISLKRLKISQKYFLLFSYVAIPLCLIIPIFNKLCHWANILRYFTEGNCSGHKLYGRDRGFPIQPSLHPPKKAPQSMPKIILNH